MVTEFNKFWVLFVKLYFCQSSVVSVTKTYDFAGEEIKVTETISADSCKAAEQVDTKSSDGSVTAAADSQETKKTKLVKCMASLTKTCVRKQIWQSFYPQSTHRL